MRWIRWLFIVAAIYDGVLGLVFLGGAPAMFERAGVTPPNHFGYVHFPALLLVLFAAMFAQIARDPVRWRALIPYGCGLKVAYCGVVFFHLAGDAMPSMWIPFAWADLAFLALFALAWRRLGAPSAA